MSNCLKCGNSNKRNSRKYCSLSCSASHQVRHKISEKERKEKDKLRSREHRRTIKEEAVKYKGGKCSICDYNKNIKALDFHHTDPTKKDFSVSDASTRKMSWDKIKKEIDKCILVCSNCHREIHDE